MSKQNNALFYLPCLAITLMGLAGCADNFSVEAPGQNISAKSNIRNRNAAPQIERKLYESSSQEQSAPELDDEDDATAQLLKTAEKMIATNDFVSASVLYQRALSTNPESISALKGMAHMAERRNKPQEALQAYREIIRIDNNNEMARRGVAKNLSTLGLYDKAIDELKKLQAIKGDDPEIFNQLGMAYTRADDVPAHFQKAVESFKSSLTLDPERIGTQNNLGFTYILAGRLPEAIELFEKLIEDPRTTVQHRQNLALAYGLSGRENDARKIAMQDLPRAAVEKNIQSYRAMRAKAQGKELGRASLNKDYVYSPSKASSKPVAPATDKKTLQKAKPEAKPATIKPPVASPVPAVEKEVAPSTAP